MQPLDSACVAGVIFFNNVGYLGMCGHGMIGVVTTLSHLNRIEPVTINRNAVGRITATLHADRRVSHANVPSYRLATNVTVAVDGFGAVSGDVAWGGNWFFLVEHHGQRISADNVTQLTRFSCSIRAALKSHGISGTNGDEIDHIELFGSPSVAGAHSKNFVLCPGLAYDRSPCGTGTSAKLACVIADGKLKPGQI